MDSIKTRFPETGPAEVQTGCSMTIWDCDADPEEHSGEVYRWNGYAEGGAVHSLLKYAEANGERLRRKYLAWIHELGESRINGKRLIDELEIEKGLSYWWMTLLFEKSFYKSPITDVIRLLALDEVIVRLKPSTLNLASANRNLHETLRAYCRDLGISYRWTRPADQSRQHLCLRAIYRALPQPIQGLLGLLHYLCLRWPLRQSGMAKWSGGERSVLFCSYFIHLDKESCAAGQFHSHQWEELPRLLHERGIRTNWIQHYLPSSAVPNTKVAKDWIGEFNKLHGEREFHCFLDAHLSWGIVLRVVRRWVSLSVRCWDLRGIKRAFNPPGSRLSLWPIMRSDWRASMCGRAAVNNILGIELFDRALRNIPRQNKGLYLCENQAWERALIHAWRKHGHGELVAAVHATVRFWDMRYFTDARTDRLSDRCRLPQPDLVALNGRAAVDAYLAMDFPKERIAECEALRYGYLRNIGAPRRSRRGKGDPLDILILGDYLPSATDKMLQLIEAAVPLTSDCITCSVKPHPSCPIEAEHYPSLNLRILLDSLELLLHRFDIAYSSSITSAALDAYLGGLPVVVMRDETTLNFSPLRGQPGVCFVNTPEELVAALQTCTGEAMRPDHNQWFLLEPALPRWQSLLLSERLA